MNILIKYHEKTSDENQMFCLDSSKHHQVIPLHDNIEIMKNPYFKPEPFPYSDVRIDLTKYEGRMVYGIFLKYSRIDGYSIFEVDENIIENDRDYKLKQLLQ